ncbi:carboxypeptidase regulatory-like domain-containing protein [Myxococcus sp. Y35]|uniref:carboxypeptidase regulatory-like domain-containing protein n=1 Tax=Pseudomyxococcus flavus TaxID=3115648 RepID=UPI003CECCF16
MRRGRQLAWAALLAVLGGTGCMFLEESPDPSQLVCRADTDCAHNEVCFPDGCGDPGRDIVVEVTPNPDDGLHAQDFRVEAIRPELDLALFGPATVQGSTVRVTSAPGEGGTTTRPYSEPLRLSASGESALLPGVVRSFTAHLVPINGRWELPVGTGTYTVTLSPEDLGLPPVRGSATVEPGGAVPLPLVLPSPHQVARLEGQVVRQGAELVDADLEVQALDADLTPLSQRVPVARATGAFALALPVEAAQRASLLLRVTAAGAPWVPQKTFTVDPREPLTAPLELGDAGEPVQVSGRILARDGQPVAQASVSLRGTVGGGGTFQGPLAVTDAEGRFTVQTLPSAPGSRLSLVVVPPSGSTAGLTVQAVDVPRGGAVLPDVVCPERRILRGTLLQTDNTQPAPGVRVLAEPIGQVPGWPRPPAGGESLGTTDDTGSFRLWLDPGIYRVDFIPTENLPRVSRVVTVQPGDDTGEQVLATFPLQRGRTVRGTVTEAGQAAPYASVRFYRVANLEGRPSSVLLSQTVSDHLGRYTALLPVR